MADLKDYQAFALYSPFEHMGFFGGVACVAAGTKIETKDGPVQISEIKAKTQVWSMGDKGPELRHCGQPYVKGRAQLFRVIHEEGQFDAHALHLVALVSGEFVRVCDLRPGQSVLSYYPYPQGTNLGACQKVFDSNDQSSNQKPLDFPGGYQAEGHSCDQRPLAAQEFALTSTQPQICEPGSTRPCEKKGAPEASSKDNHLGSRLGPLTKLGYACRRSPQASIEANLPFSELIGRILGTIRKGLRFQWKSECRPLKVESFLCREPEPAPCKGFYPLKCSKVKQVFSTESVEFWDLEVPVTNNYLAEGAVHHNSGKTFTGSHFVLECVEQRPDLTGLIGANNHDQLSQASMRELIYWMDEYGYDYEIDCKPPNVSKKFKSYKNVLSIRSKKKPKVWTPVLTRIMSAPNPLRGIEFAWYWLDETRDTPENTHDVVLSRMRESSTFRRGLLTSTTNGEDWAFKRFVKGARKGQRMYGSMHIPTSRAVEKGTISKDYYNLLRSTYSELMAMQELDALHVNVRGGRAYYAFGKHNEHLYAPWGDLQPTYERPLIVGCDFNFTPAPCVWMVGQIGPALYGPRGEFWGKSIHWFSEISGVEKSTAEMTSMLVNRFPGYIYRIFGDSSGNRGTTSNAGRTDYMQMADVLYEARASFTIDADQSNPMVKDRVENMNRLAMNSLGQVHQTYNPNTCPLFHSDTKVVGWKKSIGLSRSARLDDGGDKQLTHASDGAGYAVYKLFPPAFKTFQGGSMPSPNMLDIDGAF